MTVFYMPTNSTWMFPWGHLMNKKVDRKQKVAVTRPQYKLSFAGLSVEPPLQLSVLSLQHFILTKKEEDIKDERGDSIRDPIAYGTDWHIEVTDKRFQLWPYAAELPLSCLASRPHIPPFLKLWTRLQWVRPAHETGRCWEKHLGLAARARILHTVC